MSQKRVIAIIGATREPGSTMAAMLSQVGRYRLLLMSDNESELATLTHSLMANGTEIVSFSCAREASWEADIIIVARADESIQALAEKIREVAIGKIIICPLGQADSLTQSKPSPKQISSAQELQHLLPYSKVVKTFAGGDEVLIAGNNGEATGIASEIIASIGLQPAVVGDLSVSTTLETLQRNRVSAS